MDFVVLDDPEFQDFNFLLGYAQALRPGGGPGHQELYEMVIQARRGDPVGAQEFAGVMGLTLRPEAFESFQRTFTLVQDGVFAEYALLILKGTPIFSR